MQHIIPLQNGLNFEVYRRQGAGNSLVLKLKAKPVFDLQKGVGLRVQGLEFRVQLAEPDTSVKALIQYIDSGLGFRVLTWYRYHPSQGGRCCPTPR